MSTLRARLDDVRASELLRSPNDRKKLATNSERIDTVAFDGSNVGQSKGGPRDTEGVGRAGHRLSDTKRAGDSARTGDDGNGRTLWRQSNNNDGDERRRNVGIEPKRRSKGRRQCSSCWTRTGDGPKADVTSVDDKTTAPIERYPNDGGRSVSTIIIITTSGLFGDLISSSRRPLLSPTLLLGRKRKCPRRDCRPPSRRYGKRNVRPEHRRRRIAAGVIRG